MGWSWVVARPCDANPPGAGAGARESGVAGLLGAAEGDLGVPVGLQRCTERVQLMPVRLCGLVRQGARGPSDAGVLVRFEAELYTDAPHGFTMSDTAAYREHAAEKHFRRLVDLLERNLAGNA